MADLMNADIALVTEDHLVAVLSFWRSTHVAHHILVVFDAQAFLRLNGLLHLLFAHILQLNQNKLHRQLIEFG